MCEVVSKNIAFLKNIVFPKNPLFSHKTHCFPTCALFYPIVLKRKIITDYMHCSLLLWKLATNAIKLKWQRHWHKRRLLLFTKNTRNVCCVLVFYVFCCYSVCWFLDEPFCHGALELWHIYIVYNILSLNISSVYITYF